MLTRLMFGGGTAGGTEQVLIMESGYMYQQPVNGHFFGYNAIVNPTIGSLSPSVLTVKGKTFKITALMSAHVETFGGGESTAIHFDGELPGSVIKLEVRGKVYSFSKSQDSQHFSTSGMIFTSESTYTIKILSIE